MTNRIDAEFVIYRLEEAGRTLLSLPGKGCMPNGFGSGWPEVAQAVIEAYVGADEDPSVATPSASAIGRMDEAFKWIGHISLAQRSHRRIVLMRSLISPRTERHRWTWRRIGTTLGWDYRAVQNWHSQGIDMIVDGLIEAQRAASRPKPAIVIKPFVKDADAIAAPA